MNVKVKNAYALNVNWLGEPISHQECVERMKQQIKEMYGEVKITDIKEHEMTGTFHNGTSIEFEVEDDERTDKQTSVKSE